MTPTRPPTKRKSTKALSNSKNILPDEMDIFLQQDSINDIKGMRADIWDKRLSYKNYIFDCNNEYISIQSRNYVKNTGILKFELKTCLIMHSIIVIRNGKIVWKQGPYC